MDDSDINVNENNINIEINFKESTSSVKYLIVVRNYIDNYLCFGFTWNNNIDCPVPVYIICGEKLSNEQ